MGFLDIFRSKDKTLDNPVPTEPARKYEQGSKIKPEPKAKSKPKLKLKKGEQLPPKQYS